MPVLAAPRTCLLLFLLPLLFTGCGGTCKCRESGEASDGTSDAGPVTGDDQADDAVVATGDPRVLVINEVDYDNPGSDAHEFIEIHNPGSEDVALAGLAVLLINGDSGAEYDRYALDASAPVLPAGGYLVIGSASLLATLPAGALQITLVGNLQNGAPDGVAIVDTVGARMIDTLSYEGALVSALIPELGGPVTLVEAVPTPVVDNNALGSLARTPNGQDTDVARDDWQYAPVPTPGVSN